MRYVMRRLGGVAVLIAATSPAFAATPSEDIVTAWLDSLVPDGTELQVGASRYDAARDTVTLEDVTIGDPETGGFALAIGSIEVVDPRTTDDGLFAGHGLTYSDLRLEMAIPSEGDFGVGPKDVGVPAGRMIFELDEGRFERFAVPTTFEIPSLDDPFALWVSRAASFVDEIDIGHQEYRTFVVYTEGAPAGDTRQSYEFLSASGIHGGRVEWTEYGPYTQTSPIPMANGETAELVMSVRHTRSVGFDLSAMIAALDPEAPAGADWAPVLLSSTIEGISISMPEATIEIAGGAWTGFSMRPTGQPIVDLIEQIYRDPTAAEADPFGMVEGLSEGLFGLISLEEMALRDIVFTGSVGRVTVGLVSLNDMDAEGFGAFRVEDTTVDVFDQGSGSLEAFAVHDVTFGALMPLLQAFALDPLAEPPVDLFVGATPQIGWVSASGFTLTLPNKPPVTLAELSISGDDFSGGLAQESRASVRGFVLPAAVIDEPEAQEALADMGIDTLDIDFAYSMNWRAEKGLFTIEQATLRVAGLGNVSFDAAIGNVPLSILLDPLVAEAALLKATLISASVRFGNEGLIEKLSQYFGAQNGTEPGAFREGIAAFVTLGLGQYPAVREVLGGPISAFAETPVSFEMSAAPDSPASFGTLEELSMTDPAAAVALVNLTATANE